MKLHGLRVFGPIEDIGMNDFQVLHAPILLFHHGNKVGVEFNSNHPLGFLNKVFHIYFVLLKKKAVGNGMSAAGKRN